MGNVNCSRNTRPRTTAAGRRRSFRHDRPVASLRWSKGRGCTALLLATLLSAGVLNTALAQQAAGSSCPVSLTYAADLGRGGANSKTPTFAGRVNITNTASQVAMMGLDTTALHSILRRSTEHAVKLLQDWHVCCADRARQGAM
jgi:hypothetical protein